MIYVRHFGRSQWGLVATHFSNALVKAAKSVPGMRWEPSARAWVGYVDAVALTAAHLARSGIHIDTRELPKAGDFEDTLLPIKDRDLRCYQREGVRFILAHAADGCLLADGMRLGKTAQALRAGRALKTIALAVCPGFVKGVWAREAAKWWPEARVIVLEGIKPEKKNALADVDWRATKQAIVVCNYDILYAWAEHLQPLVKFVIFDEAHMLMSDRSRRTKAAQVVAHAAPYRVALSGTPMQNRPSDLWAVVDTISQGRFGKPFPYYLRYCGAYQEQVTREKTVWKFDRVSNPEELSARM